MVSLKEDALLRATPAVSASEPVTVEDIEAEADGDL